MATFVSTRVEIVNHYSVPAAWRTTLNQIFLICCVYFIPVITLYIVAGFNVV